MKMKLKTLTIVIVGMILSVIAFAVTAARQVEANVATASMENKSNPDTLLWFLGAIVVVLFIFIVVLILAKGTKALSENLEDKYRHQNQPT